MIDELRELRKQYTRAVRMLDLLGPHTQQYRDTLRAATELYHIIRQMEREQSGEESTQT